MEPERFPSFIRWFLSFPSFRVLSCSHERLSVILIFFYDISICSISEIRFIIDKTTMYNTFLKNKKNCVLSHQITSPAHLTCWLLKHWQKNLLKKVKFLLQPFWNYWSGFQDFILKQDVIYTKCVVPNKLYVIWGTKY